MKVNDHGFTERVGTAIPAPSEAGKTGTGRSVLGPQKTGTDDNLHLSGFAARLNDGLESDASNRADHVSRVTNAVNSGVFQFDTSAVSRSIISEALQSRG